MRGSLRFVARISSCTLKFCASLSYNKTLSQSAFRPPSRLSSKPSSYSPRPISSSASAMAHVDTMIDLTATLRSLGISEVPRLPNTNPALNPVDVYRSHITELLAPIVGVDPKIVQNALQWTQTLATGDLVLPVPALRVKGKKPDELAKEIGEKVSEASITLSLGEPLTKRRQPPIVSRLSSHREAHRR